MRLLALTAALMLTVTSAAASREVPRGQTLVIGKVSDKPRKHYKRLRPMLDYAVERLADQGIRAGEVVMARDNEEMIELLRSGQVDWVTETAFSALRYVDDAGARVLVRKWKKGVPEYHTVFITRRNSDIHTLSDLTGRRLALEDPGSSTAFFLPVGALLDTGLTPQELPRRDAPVPHRRVGYTFAGGEINITAWVARGIVDAGAYSNIDWADPDHTPRAMRENLRIFHHGEPIPRAFEIVRGDLRPGLREALRRVLLDAENVPAGRRAMQAYQSTTRFDAITPTIEAQLATVRRCLASVREMLAR